jgi:hypothetical protein
MTQAAAVERVAEPLAGLPLTGEEQQLHDRAHDLRLPWAPADEEFMRLGRGDQAAALTLVNDFDRGWRKTVDRLLHDKAVDLVLSGEYGDPDDYCRVVEELPDGSREVEYDLLQEAEEDAEEWLRELRPDLFAEHERVADLAYAVARIAPSPSRVRALAERSGFYFALRLGLHRRRLDRRGARVHARSRGAGRPRGRRARRARSPSSSSGDDSDSSGDGESDPPVGGALTAAWRWVA